MREKLELKILALVIILLLIGICAAAFMVLTIEKKSLYSMTEVGAEATAKIIARDVERIMLEGRADLTDTLLDDLKGASGIEGISVLNYQGREAFKKDAPATDEGIMKKIAETKMPQKINEKTRILFYETLKNKEQCRACHLNDPEILGAVKVSISIEKEYKRSMQLSLIVILVTVIACLSFSIILWMMIRKMVISPIKSLEKAAQELAKGDLSFAVDLKSKDEIGKLGRAVKGSMLSVSGILNRVREISMRIANVAEEVASESKKVVDGTILENDAISEMSASVEEMNASISEIADSTEALAVSAEETVASMGEMVTSITQINGSTQDLSVAVESTSASIEQLSATIKEVAKNASELGGAAEETQSAIMEISSSVKEVEQRARESSLLSGKVNTDATTLGMASIGKAIDGMKEIKASVENTAGYIRKLGGRSEEIGQILNVIDEITDQTALLALNAAILAAQAGEHGKGFSVVADEIKNLADRTSVSTQEIGELIQAVQQEVAGAVEAMELGLKSVQTGFKVTGDAADALRKIVESSKQSSDMSAAIERSTTEQAQATRMVSDAMDKVLRMVGEIAKATSEQNRGIQLIMKATEKVSDVAGHVRTATNEQSLNSKQISRAIELVSDKSKQISRAIHEQKTGATQIWKSIESIKEIPKENKELAFNLNQRVKDLMKDAELAATEMERFTLAEDSSAGRLRMGIIPLESPAIMHKKFLPLAEYLGTKLRRRIELKVAVDFQGAVNDIGQNVTQFCFMTPSTYIEAHMKYGVSVLLKALRDGKPFQHSVIIARSDSALHDIRDIKGRSFAFGDLHSTSSHIVPRAMLLAEGIEMKDLKLYHYLGHHDDVAEAVLNGDFDAGAVMESTAYKYKDRGIKFIKISDEIPEFNICTAKNLDGELKKELQSALIALDPDSSEGATILKSINESYTGFVESSDEEYDGIKNMMISLGLI
ncbi:MAG: methyl-accepting protein RppA [Nitrospirae bacterium]|nr:methyl-accepting protein RppA [Nitrospirota bacterium]